MNRVGLIVAVILLSAAPHLWAAAHQPKNPANVFDSFHLLDTRFTKLDGQFRDLQGALASDGSHAHKARDWQQAAKAMRATTSEIRLFSYRMYLRYRGHRTLGQQMFGRLHSRAGILRARLLSLAGARSQKLARREESRVKKALLDLVLQYQALSGGYAGATCSAGEWSCGVAKKEPRKVGYPGVGVKWTCVRRTVSCQGILGPRSPLLTEAPLTSNPQTQ